MPDFSTDPVNQYIPLQNGTVDFTNKLGDAVGGGFNYPIPTVPFSIGTGQRYFVKTPANGGSDANNGTDPSTSFATLDYALGFAINPGDTVDVFQGTYVETGNYVIENTSYFSSMQVRGDGTEAEKITIRANPGDEGLVIFDDGGLLGGLGLNYRNHIQVYGLNFQNQLMGAIHCPDGETDDISSSKSTGCRFERNRIINTSNPDPGVNTAAFRVFGIENSIIRDNFVQTTDPYCNAVQGYGQSNILVEHNDLDVMQGGVYWKGHLLDGGLPMALESEVRFNNIIAGQPFQQQAQGGGTAAAGYSWVHNNILRARANILHGGMYCSWSDMGDGGGQSTRLLFEFNSCYGVQQWSTMMEATSHNQVELYGNIAVNMSMPYHFGGAIGGNTTALTLANYNLYEYFNANYAVMDQYDTNTTDYASLAAFQAETIANAIAVSFQLVSPEPNTVLTTAAQVYTNPGVDFTNPGGSIALGFMPDGSNAGAYRLGTETIGKITA